MREEVYTKKPKCVQLKRISKRNDLQREKRVRANDSEVQKSKAN